MGFLVFTKSMNKIIPIIAAVLIFVGGLWFFTKNNSDAPKALDNQNTGATSEEVMEQSDETIMNTIENNKIMSATLHTNMGDITVEFNKTDAPNTVANFIKLAESGFYNGTKFHRVIKGFMNQGGDPLTKDDSQIARWGTGGPGYSFPDEITSNNSNDVGTISMANAGPNTNGSQFFINVLNNSSLNGKHTVFGRVTTGLDVVMAINGVETGGQDRPIVPVVLESVTLK